MSGNLPETVAEIVQSIEDGVAALEARLASHVEQLDALLQDLESERSSLGAALEEHNIERMLAPPGAGDDDQSWVGDQLLDQIDRLTGEYTSISALRREIAGFLHLLVFSRRQFRVDGQLAGTSDAQRLAIRQAMIRAQEDERRRLAREIHDGPAQVLANAIIGMEFVGRSLQARGPEGTEQAIGEIERIKGAMRDGLTEIRRFIFDLRPTMLSQRGLVGTVEHYIQTYRHLFPGELELSLDPDLPKLSPDQEMAAFRVIQESLQNVHRHARSSRTEVAILREGDNVIVRIADDGEGFRPGSVKATSTSGFGLGGMRERAEVIGGQLRIDSSPNQGTRVDLIIPLNARLTDEVSRAAHVRGAGIEPGADSDRR